MGEVWNLEHRTIAFLGVGCERYARFCAALIASANPKGSVLVWDASTCRSLFVGTVGDASEKTVYFRSMVYTIDTEYARSHLEEYDVIIVADDFAKERGSFREYGDYIDNVYLCMSANRYALEVMLRAASSIVGKKLPVTYIFCGSSEDVERWRVREYWKYLQGRNSESRKTLYIPLCESDMQAMLRLEYGLFRMKDLSDGMHDLFFDFSEKLNIDSNVIQGIEQSTMFNT